MRRRGLLGIDIGTSSSPQEARKQLIGASFGDAALAYTALRGTSPIDDWNLVSDVIEPDPSTRGLYDELYSLYRDLYPATCEQMHALASLQERLAAAPMGSAQSEGSSDDGHETTAALPAQA